MPDKIMVEKVSGLEARKAFLSLVMFSSFNAPCKDRKLIHQSKALCIQLFLFRSKMRECVFDVLTLTSPAASPLTERRERYCKSHVLTPKWHESKMSQVGEESFSPCLTTGGSYARTGKQESILVTTTSRRKKGTRPVTVMMYLKLYPPGVPWEC